MNWIKMPLSMPYVPHGRSPVTRAPGKPHAVRREAAVSADELNDAIIAPVTTSAAGRVLVTDADSAVYGLISEWLVALGYCVVQGASAFEPPPGKFDLVIADIPFPRQRGSEVLSRIREAHRDTPIIALSSQFFAGAEGAGAIARALGVARALAKPLTREALCAAVQSVREDAP